MPRRRRQVQAAIANLKKARKGAHPAKDRESNLIHSELHTPPPASPSGSTSPSLPPFSTIQSRIDEVRAHLNQTFDVISQPVESENISTTLLPAKSPSPPTLSLGERQLDNGFPQAASPLRTFHPAPDRAECREALIDINSLLNPKKSGENGHRQTKGPEPFLEDRLLQERLELIALHLTLYTRPIDSFGWIESSRRAANSKKRGRSTANQIRVWARDFLVDRQDLPKSECLNARPNRSLRFFDAYSRPEWQANRLGSSEIEESSHSF